MILVLLFAVLTIVGGVDHIWNPNFKSRELVQFFNTHKPMTMTFNKPDLNSNIPGFYQGAPAIKRPTRNPSWVG